MRPYCLPVTHAASLLFILFGLMAALPSIARVYTHETSRTFYADDRTFNHRVLIDLNGEWKDKSDKVYIVPFSAEGFDQLELHREFFLTQVPEDSLVLYFEGMAQRCEIYLNDKLLTITSDPFLPYAIQLTPEMFIPQWNRLRVILHAKGRPRQSLEPFGFIGIHRPVYLLEKSMGVYQQVRFPKWRNSDSTLYFSPYGENGYKVNTEEFKATLRLLKNSGTKCLYVPYRLSNQQYYWIAEAEMELALRPGRWCALFEANDKTRASLPDWPIWKQNDGSGRWGIYVDRQQINRLALPTAGVPWLAGICLSVLALFAVWKAGAPAVFSDLLGRRNRRLRASRSESERQSTSTVLQVWLVRVVIVTLVYWSFGLLLRQAYHLDFLDIFSAPSRSHRLFLNVEGNLAALSFALFLFVLGVQVIKHLLLRTLSATYGIRDFSFRVATIENRAAFPWLWVLLLVSVLGLVQAPLGGQAWVWILGALCLMWWVYRQAYIAYNLRRQLRLRQYAIVLYICAIEWVPWIFVL